MKDPVLFTFFNEIGIIDQLARAAFEEVLPDGMTVSQFSLLNHLVRRGDNAAPSDLARAFQVTKGAMTNTITRLEGRGLIRVKPDPEDARGKRVFLTAKGRRARDTSIAALAPLLEQISGAFPEKDFQAALPFVQSLRAFLDAARDHP